MKTPDFPKTMTHPAHQRGASIPIPTVDAAGRTVVDYQGTPDRFPPVVVNNSDQEEQHRAMGYIAFGEHAATAAAYQEYPKMLTHPEYEPAVEMILEQRNGANQVISPGVPGTPAKFPSLGVHNPDEEEAALAKGYLQPGKSDPDAVQASISSPYDPARVTQEWPRMVNGVLTQDPSINTSGFQEYPKWIGDKMVNSLAEEWALTGRKPDDRGDKLESARKRKAALEAQLAAANTELAAGDADAGPAAPLLTSGTGAAPPVPATVTTLAAPPADERQTLIAEADTLGITINKSWNTGTLRKRVEAARKAA
jgi:hypothetical protein